MFVYSVGNGLVYPNAMHGALQVEAKSAGCASALAGALQLLLGTVATAAVGQFAESSVSAAVIVLGCASVVWAGILGTRPAAGIVVPGASRQAA
jgi:DHA1 family bicyclomycin/chloramphenicol resistance-like MFS transporter